MFLIVIASPPDEKTKTCDHCGGDTEEDDERNDEERDGHCCDVGCL